MARIVRHRFGRLSPDYLCQQRCIEAAEAACQRIPGGGIDEAVGRLLVQSVTPLTLEVALNVQDEIQTRLAEADRLRRQQLQRAQYEADRARVRYMRVDPNNRLVADTLEAQWNEKLRLLAQAKEDYETQQRADAAQLTAEQKSKIMALAADFSISLAFAKNVRSGSQANASRLLVEDVTCGVTRKSWFKYGLKAEPRRNFVCLCQRRLGPCAKPNRRLLRKSTASLTRTRKKK